MGLLNSIRQVVKNFVEGYEVGSVDFETFAPIVGLFGFKEVGGSEKVGKCHFSLPLSIQTPEEENKKTFFLFSFLFCTTIFLLRGCYS